MDTLGYLKKKKLDNVLNVNLLGGINEKCKFIWKCPECYKIIKSKTESKTQFEYNKEQHIKSHGVE